MEVISAKLNGNGTVSTAVDVNQLQSHHRRARRSSKEIDLASFQSRISHKVLKFSEERETQNCDIFIRVAILRLVTDRTIPTVT